MAGEILANLAPALSQTFAKDIVRAWNREAVLAKLIPFKAEGGQGEGKNVSWDVSFTGATAQTFVEGSDVAVGEFQQDVDVPAVLAWGQYRSAFQLSNLEINAASRSIANAAALADIVGHRLEGSVAKIASVVNADLWAGTGTSGGNPSIVGLYGTAANGALVSSGIYAGLATATYPEWASNVLTNGGVARPLTFALLSQLEKNIYTASGRKPTCIVTSPGVASKYEGLFETEKRVIDVGGAGVARYDGSMTQGQEGMRTSLYWRGIPVYRDRNAPAGTLMMLDLDNIEGKLLPFNPLSPDGVPVSAMNAPSSNGQTVTPTPLIVNIYPLARLGSAIKFAAEIYVQLKVSRTNAQGLLGDLVE